MRVDRTQAHALGLELRSCGFTEDSVREALFPTEASLPVHIDPSAVLSLRPTPKNRLGSLIRLLVSSEAITPREFLTALPTFCSANGAYAYPFRSDRSRVRSALSFSPVGDIVLAHDSVSVGLDSAKRDYVAPPSVTSHEVLRLVPPDRFDVALDYGCGTGLHALAIAAQCRYVIAADINSRAVDLCRYNALLNEVRNIRHLRTDSPDTLRDHTFNLIVSNPPYVLSPSFQSYVSDNFEPRDKFCRRLVRSLIARLAPSGILICAAHWVCDPSRTWVDPLRDWLPTTGFDCVALKSRELDPIAYAEYWSLGSLEAAERRRSRIDEWARYLQANNIHRISTGILIVQRHRSKDLQGSVHGTVLQGPIGPNAGLSTRSLLFAAARERRISSRVTARSVVVLAKNTLLLKRATQTGDGNRTTSGQIHYNLDLPTGVNLSDFGLKVAEHLDGRSSVEAIAAHIDLDTRVGRSDSNVATIERTLSLVKILESLGLAIVIANR